MIEKTIFLNRIEDVKKLVNITMSKSYDIELLSDKYVANGKSIMGIFGLDLTKPVRLIAHSDDDELLNQLSEFEYIAQA
ncbi:MAG: HPr family phosphocarrier protein [bacterium]|nr:HPr family phosphocarrier protein [bacterium]